MTTTDRPSTITPPSKSETILKSNPVSNQVEFFSFDLMLIFPLIFFQIALMRRFSVSRKASKLQRRAKDRV